jgi:alpha-galactosidase/6-phospho-beta-glucosidase family protein
MWHRVDVVLTDISEERMASIFRVEDKKMEMIRSSETLVNTISTRPTSQKTAFFVVTSVKTSNLTDQHVVYCLVSRQRLLFQLRDE